MMSTTFIGDLYSHQSFVLPNKALYSFVMEFTEAFFQDNIAPLQRETLVVELLYTYKYFGFALFSHLGRELFAQGLGEIIGIQSVVLQDYLQELRDSFPEGQGVVWQEESALEDEFCAQLVKNVFCMLEKESGQSGLANFVPNVIAKMRDLNKQCLSFYEQNGKKISEEFLIASAQNSGLALKIIDHSINCLFAFTQNPLKLFIWRVECFLAALFCGEEEVGIVQRFSNEEIQDKAQIFAGIIVLLSSSQEGEGAFLQTPVSVNRFVKFLSSESFLALSFPFFRTVSLGQKGLLEKFRLSFAQGVELGLFYKTLRGRSVEYGLTRSALQIFSPYQAILHGELLVGCKRAGADTREL